MSLEKAFGTILRNARNKQGLSQEELAFKTNLDRTFISLLERGKRRPTIRTLFILSRTLKIKPHQMIKQVEGKANENT